MATVARPTSKLCHLNTSKTYKIKCNWLPGISIPGTLLPPKSTHKEPIDLLLFLQLNYPRPSESPCQGCPLWEGWQMHNAHWFTHTTPGQWSGRCSGLGWMRGWGNTLAMKLWCQGAEEQVQDVLWCIHENGSDLWKKSQSQRIQRKTQVFCKYHRADALEIEGIFVELYLILLHNGY